MKVDKHLILAILAILILSFLAYLRFRAFKRLLPETKVPKFEIPKIKFFPEEEEKEEREFLGPDKNFKFKYFSDWLIVGKKVVEHQYPGEFFLEKGETLFLAQKLSLEKMAFAFLIAQQFETEKNLREIVEEMKKDVEKRGGKMQILKLDEEKGILEASYQKEGQIPFHSLERFLRRENKIYSIVILTSERDWQELKEEAKEIINSAQLVE